MVVVVVGGSSRRMFAVVMSISCGMFASVMKMVMVGGV